MNRAKSQQLKLFPAHVEAPADDPQVARVLIGRVRLERTRQFGACYLGLELWRRLALDRFFQQALDDDPADVPWSRVAALLAINRLRASCRKRPSWNGTSRSVLQAELARMPSLAPMKRARPRPGTRCRA